MLCNAAHRPIAGHSGTEAMLPKKPTQLTHLFHALSCCFDLRWPRLSSSGFHRLFQLFFRIFADLKIPFNHQCVWEFANTNILGLIPFPREIPVNVARHGLWLWKGRMEGADPVCTAICRGWKEQQRFPDHSVFMSPCEHPRLDHYVTQQLHNLFFQFERIPAIRFLVQS